MWTMKFLSEIIFRFTITNIFWMWKVSKKILGELAKMKEGLRESYEWYSKNKSRVKKKDFIAFIDSHLEK